MKMVIQRVTEASVTVDDKVVGSIGKGFMVLLGVAQTDTEDIASRMVKKLSGLRIFSDAEGKTNLSLSDVGGELLIISQFTLYADCHKGNRPSFVHAGAPDMAESLYEFVLSEARKYVPKVEKGIFGAEMKVSLVNDGPFTIIYDSKEMFGV